MPTTPAESQAVLDAASMLIGMGASQVFVFGSWSEANCGRIPISTWQYRVCPAKLYLSAVSRASDILGRPVDLVDLDYDTALVRYLLDSQELIRVETRI